MTTVCVGDGLTVDGDGKLIVDICPDGGLEFVAGCLQVDENPLHRARVYNATDVTIGVAAADTTRTLTLQTLSVAGTQVGGMPDPAGGLTVRQDGLYALNLNIGDNPSSDNTGGDVAIGIAIMLNGVQCASNRMTRLVSQSHELSCSAFLYLTTGDRIQAQFNIHRVGGPTVPHDLLAGPGFELSATQMMTQYVGSVA